jgi:hypothetical protein
MVSDKRGVGKVGRPKVYCREVLAHRAKAARFTERRQLLECIKHPQRSAADFSADWMRAENCPTRGDAKPLGMVESWEGRINFGLPIVMMVALDKRGAVMRSMPRLPIVSAWGLFTEWQRK